jgi:hypothetical protein
MPVNGSFSISKLSKLAVVSTTTVYGGHDFGQPVEFLADQSSTPVFEFPLLWL